MDEILKALSPSMQQFFLIAVGLRDTVRGIDKIYMEAIKEVESVWKSHKKKH